MGGWRLALPLALLRALLEGGRAQAGRRAVWAAPPLPPQRGGWWSPTLRRARTRDRVPDSCVEGSRGYRPVGPAQRPRRPGPGRGGAFRASALVRGLIDEGVDEVPDAPEVLGKR